MPDTVDESNYDPLLAGYRLESQGAVLAASIMLLPDILILLLILCAFDIDSLILAAVLAVAGLVYTIFVLVGFGEYFLASRANIRLLKKRY